MPLFPDIDALESYVNTNIIANGVGAITGPIDNKAFNGSIEFIRKSPLNWGKALLRTAGGVVNLTDEYLGVVVFSTTTTTSLSFGNNIYNEYVFINMTANVIPLVIPAGYYNASGVLVDYIPANSAVNIFLVSNDLWVLGSGSGGGGGSTQKQPKTYIVGTTPDAPVAGESTWTLPAFLNSWVVLVLARSIIVDMTDAGDGSAYITKALGSDTLTITNWVFNPGDVLSFILITP